MRLSTLILSTLAVSIFAAGCSRDCAKPGSTDSGHHYFDCQGDPLPQWDFIWSKLFAFFGTSTQETIVVDHSSGTTSRFHPQDQSIVLGSGMDRIDVVAHESTHLCNYNLTNGVSVANGFRFLDEGFAEIMEYNVQEEGDWYKTYALMVAQQENQAGNVSFAKVQDWSSYFKNGAPNSDSHTWNWRAYQVGSSFEFLIMDTKGGEDALRSFLIDIGNTKDIDTTFRNVFASTSSGLEKEWQAYLNQVQIDPSTPAVVQMSPPDQATGVPLDTTEISVTFSVAMDKSICVNTPCGDTGVCYTDAYWKAHDVLAIKVVGGLKPGYGYRLELGSGASGCQMKSNAGAALPLTSWQFTAASQ
jgi:hypothetical protein